MEVRPEYKLTEIGIIPEDWGVEVIGDLACITTGAKNTQDRQTDGLYPFFVRSQKIERINSWSYDGEAVLTAGDGVGTGKVFHYINGKFDVHQRVYRISDFSPKLIGYFFFLYFSNNFYARIMQMTAKSSVDSVRMEMIAGMKIPIPVTRAEQSAIATALRDVEALLAAQDALIAKKRAIKQGAMQELLTGKRRLPGFSGEWEECVLGGIATFHKGKGLPKSDLTDDGPNQCIHYGELFTQYGYSIYETISRTWTLGDFLSIENDVLMPTSDVTPRGLAKASCVVINGVVIGGDILVIRTEPSTVSGTFLSLVIRHEEEQVLRLVTGSTVFHLYGADMKKFVFKLPSILEQRAIVEALCEMDIEINVLETQRAKTAQLKQGMMQALLTGRIRLV